MTEPPAARRLASPVTRVLRRHWALVALLLPALVLRVLTQVAYRPALLYIDSLKYLVGGLQQYDPEGYRYLMLLPVTWLGNLAVVAAVQHVLGLAMGVLLYALLVRRGGSRLAGVLAVAPVLLDGYQLQIEQMIMPDVSFEALIVAALAVLLWRPRPGLRRIGSAALLLGVAVLFRQIGEVLIVPAVGYAVLSGTRCRPRLARGALVVAVFAVPVLGYMGFSATVLHDQFRLSDQSGAVLYGRTAQAAYCATLRVPSYERQLCPSPSAAATLGVDGLVNSPASPAHTYVPPEKIGTSAAIRQFAYRVLEQQPLRVADAIAHDAVKVFALTRHTDPGDTPISRWQFQNRYPTYPPYLTRRAETALVRGNGGGGPPAVSRPLAVFLRAYQLHGGYTPGPYLLLAVIAGVAGSLIFRRHRDNTLILAALLVTATGIVVLLGADAYEFSWRYQLPALVTLPPAGALGATAAWQRIRAAVGRSRGTASVASTTTVRRAPDRG